MYLEVHKFLFEVMGILYPARLKALKVVLLQKRQIRPKSGTTIEDDETPGSKGYSGNYSNHSSGTGTTRSTYGTTGGSTYGTGSYGTSNGYSGGTSTEAERPEVQAALPQELREQPEEQKGQQQEVERPEIIQAALREPLDRQKERNK